MTIYMFEVAAKNAVIDILAAHGITASIEDLNLVWFTHLLGNKKCMIYGPVMGKMYAEITYASGSNSVYVDLYEKIDHRDLHSFDLDFEAKVKKIIPTTGR